MSRIDDLTLAVTESLSDLMDDVQPEQLTIDRYPNDLDPRIFSLQGMSGFKYRIFANRLMSFPINSSYLEIGCWMGSTAISALYNNFDVVKKHWIIDNWSEWGNQGRTRESFQKSWKEFIPDCDPNMIDADCFAINPKDHGISDVDVYLFDGNHSEESHYKSLKHYYDCMADSFIFLVDDWYAAMCGDGIREGTMRAIKDLNLKVRYQKEVSGPKERILDNGVGDAYSWWNGCGVFVLEK
jgi:hypothetical protein